MVTKINQMKCFLQRTFKWYICFLRQFKPIICKNFEHEKFSWEVFTPQSFPESWYYMWFASLHTNSSLATSAMPTSTKDESISGIVCRFSALRKARPRESEQKHSAGIDMQVLLPCLWWCNSSRLYVEYRKLGKFHCEKISTDRLQWQKLNKRNIFLDE